MDQTSYSVLGGGLTLPQISGQPYWTDSCTFVLPVKLEPGWSYELGFNSSAYAGFRSKQAEVAVPHTLVFSTTTEGLAGPDEAQAAMNEEAYSALRQAVLESYSYRDRLGLDWSRLFAEHQDALLFAPTRRHFVREVVALLSDAQDPHIWLTVEGQTIPTYARSVLPNFDNSALLRMLRSDSVVAWSKSVISGRIGEVGYILIASFSGATADDAMKSIEALRSLSDLPALIIDVRVNSGGNEFLAREFAGCFVDSAVPYAKHAVNDPSNPEAGWFGTVYTRVLEPNPSVPMYHGRVFVLTGNYVMSSCEDFLLMMRAAGATLVGDTSAGSSGNPQPHPITDGVVVYLPSWQAMDVNGVMFEGRGIDPDVFVSTKPEDFVRTDPVLEEALRLANEAIAKSAHITTE
jgi:hypothetical protein